MLNGSYVSSVAGQGVFTIYASRDFYGLDTLKLIVNDGEYSDTTDIFVEVTPVNDPPVITDIPVIEFNEDGSTSLDLDTLVIDVDSDTSLMNWEARFPGDIQNQIAGQLQGDITGGIVGEAQVAQTPGWNPQSNLPSSLPNDRYTNRQ